MQHQFDPEYLKSVLEHAKMFLTIKIKSEKTGTPLSPQVEKEFIALESHINKSISMLCNEYQLQHEIISKHPSVIIKDTIFNKIKSLFQL